MRLSCSHGTTNVFQQIIVEFHDCEIFHLKQFAINYTVQLKITFNYAAWIKRIPERVATQGVIY